MPLPVKWRAKVVVKGNRTNLASDAEGSVNFVVYPIRSMKLWRVFHTGIYFLILNFIGLFSQAQNKTNYPQQYFRWPAGAKVGLVANFGELRNNHYHMGLDIRTDQRVNVPIYAAADGYISKIKIEPFGFGRCIYINHPNGYTTLYAHLNDFNPVIESYVKERQYSMQNWKVFLDLPAGLIPVKKGEFIAYSGNTGGSQGPHLHFEIRETATDKVLNPLLFGFPVADNVAPVLLRLAVYDRNLSTYEQRPKVYPLKKINGIYQPAGGKITVNSSKISLAISAYDCVTGSLNPNGIYSASVTDNNIEKCAFVLDRISYDETRYMNAHIDFKTKHSGGPYLQHLSRLPGYLNSVYTSADGSDGIVDLEDDRPHQIDISVKDAAGNTSMVSFGLQNLNGVKESLKTSPDLFFPLEINIVDTEELGVYLPETAIYDAFHFSYSVSGVGAKKIYRLHNNFVPVQDYFQVMLRPAFSITDTGKIVMKRSEGSKSDFKKATFVNGYYRAAFREFGNYQLIYDQTAPVITPVGFRDGMNARALRRIAFIVADNTEEISFNATLDGEWLRFSNDKGKVFVYDFDEKCGPGLHELIVSAEDLAGNKTERKFRFTR